MLKKKSTLPRERYAWKGKEVGELIHLVEKEEFAGGVTFYSIIILRPGEEVGYHRHVGETEIFHVLRGQGEINDNGNVVHVAAGDIVITPTDGGHGFRNTGTEDFAFTALIMKDAEATTE